MEWLKMFYFIDCFYDAEYECWIVGYYSMPNDLACNECEWIVPGTLSDLGQ